MDKIEKVSVNGQVYELAGSGGGGGTPINITYNELVSLKSSNSLVAGAKYRITDYVTEFNTWKSAAHQFDIIVDAVSNNKLSLKASAMQHEGDEYFSNCDLSSWELWYDIDNDTSKHPQAKSGAKGCIQRMIDEYNNDAPYDFKNALYTLNSQDTDILDDSDGNIDFYLFSGINSTKDVVDLTVTPDANCTVMDNKHILISSVLGKILYQSCFIIRYGSLKSCIIKNEFIEILIAGNNTASFINNIVENLIYRGNYLGIFRWNTIKYSMTIGKGSTKAPNYCNLSSEINSIATITHEFYYNYGKISSFNTTGNITGCQLMTVDSENIPSIGTAENKIIAYDGTTLKVIDPLTLQ